MVSRGDSMSNNWIAILGSPRRGKNTEKLKE